MTGTSPSDCLVSYLGQSLERSYPSAEVQLVYSTAPADWAMSNKWWNKGNIYVYEILVALSFFIPAENNLEQQEMKTEDNNQEQKWWHKVEDNWRTKCGKVKWGDGYASIIE